MIFKNIKEYEFTPMIDAEILCSKYENHDISIGQTIYNGKVENEITIDVQYSGGEYFTAQVTFSVEQMEDLITRFKKHKMVKL